MLNNNGFEVGFIRNTIRIVVITMVRLMKNSLKVFHYRVPEPLLLPKKFIHIYVRVRMCIDLSLPTIKVTIMHESSSNSPKTLRWLMSLWEL